MKHVREATPEGIDEGWLFDLIHITALISLSVSFICCVIVLALIIVREAKVRSVQAFFKRPIGDRLVVYLAISILLFSASHTMDHAYMLAVRGNPPDTACAAFGFFVNEFLVAEALIVLFTSINAFMLVVKETKVPLRKYDWNLLVTAFGAPLVPSVILASTKHFGPTGAW